MTDTTNTEPPFPEYPVKGLLRGWYTTELYAIQQYGDARAAHAVAQIKAREVTDAEIDALLIGEVGCILQTLDIGDVRRAVRAAIALANKRD